MKDDRDARGQVVEMVAELVLKILLVGAPKSVSGSVAFEATRRPYYRLVKRCVSAISPPDRGSSVARSRLGDVVLELFQWIFYRAVLTVLQALRKEAADATMPSALAWVEHDKSLVAFYRTWKVSMEGFHIFFRYSAQLRCSVGYPAAAFSRHRSSTAEPNMTGVKQRSWATGLPHRTKRICVETYK